MFVKVHKYERDNKETNLFRYIIFKQMFYKTFINNLSGSH